MIPVSMQKRMLESLHAGHCGSTKMILRAQDMLFWPGITNDIRAYVESCESCQFLAAGQVKEPIHSLSIPEAPGLLVASDYFELYK